MKTIIYKGNQIRKWKDGTYSAYVLNADGDIEEYNRDTLEEAQAVIDKYANDNEY